MEKKLRALIKEAMIERKETGNSTRYQTYKNILEKAQKTAKDKRIDVLSDELIYDAVKKELKQLEDVLEYLNKETGGYRYEDTMSAIAYAKALLPAMASKEDMLEYLTALSVEKNMGICMKTLKGHFGALCDGKLAQETVKEYIN